ncbi:OX-2 membrane glycoprotein-like [Halichoeres trimaculatus]|uniref:OX-2 membrane glycoprotein-like n=1 Tax=Halichoeres trimaculatus TaxID=147232 RepID=UPI003D9DD440
MLSILILTALIFKGSMSEIILHGSRTADYSTDAVFSCTKHDSTGVLQVSWEKVLKESRETMATFSERFKKQVNEPYREKIIFTEASLNSTAIVIKNVTWDDESCYTCTFSVYPEGSSRKQICLTVQGISDVKTQVFPREEEDGEEDVEVEISCSATGRPAPTIEWVYSPGARLLNQQKATTVKNSDRTFTSSGNITLEVPSEWKGSVDCLLNKGVRGERLERIPLVFIDSDVNNVRRVNQLSSSGIALVVISTLFVTFLIIAIALRRNRLKSSRRNHNVV